MSLNNKLKLIEEISIATNQQSPVNEADRRANVKVQIELQKHIFQDFGLFYERKRGEFGDGIRAGYINRQNIIDREQFLRICLAIKNDPVKARSGTAHLLFEKTDLTQYCRTPLNIENISMDIEPTSKLENCPMSPIMLRLTLGLQSSMCLFLYIMMKTFLCINMTKI